MIGSITLKHTFGARIKSPATKTAEKQDDTCPLQFLSLQIQPTLCIRAPT
jgi:hypothetical protein